MNCPSRRSSLVYGLGYFGGSVAFYGTNSVFAVARADYAASAGDNDFEAQWLDGPADYATAAAWTANFPNASPTWPNVAKTNTGICYLRSQVTMADIADGASNTYLLGEKYLQPDNYFDGSDGSDNESLFNGSDNDNLRTCYYDGQIAVRTPMQDTPGYYDGGRSGSAHSDTLNMSFCDGSVQSISYSIDPETHRRLGNRQDGLTADAKKVY